ncbi:DUF485 domain-containing protein [Actinomadura rupiterrae]|uniref:DUF485 domain-containing protein n=1 Tax=Actinomadura rupiterrae TaxID=559627 RepID=UPI0027E2A0BA|nr:DUF485 domain-containing protein [Actinomadura rupiterrae]MCP2336197.1 uncharacterized membrane protein (DUF485 family) [Actinomadura rupiterrae]
MTTESTGRPEPPGGGLDEAAYLRIDESPEFQRLKSAFRRFVFPLTAAFLVWYLLYVVLSAYARDFMAKKVWGEINVALVFGLLQFVSTFLIALAYERYSRGRLEPLAAGVRSEEASLAVPAQPSEPAAESTEPSATSTEAAATESAATSTEPATTPDAVPGQAPAPDTEAAAGETSAAPGEEEGK